MSVRHHETLKTPRQIVHVLAHEPPGWAFHGVVGLAMAGFLYAVSPPGTAFLLATGMTVILLLLAIVWLMRAIGFAAARHRGEEVGHGVRLLVAPLCGVILLTLVWVDAPLRLRWAASRPAFDEVAQAIQNRHLATDRADDRRIGLYRITSVYHVPNGLVFYERTGNLFDDAGFAYLPDGPSPSLSTGSFENPQWRALGGHWYAWTASW